MKKYSNKEINKFKSADYINLNKHLRVGLKDIYERLGARPWKNPQDILTEPSLGTITNKI